MVGVLRTMGSLAGQVGAQDAMPLYAARSCGVITRCLACLIVTLGARVSAVISPPAYRNCCLH